MAPTARRAFAAGLLLCAGQLAGCAHFRPRPLSAAATLARFEARSLDGSGLRRFLAANRAMPPAPGRPWDLARLTLAALYFQPSLAEARAQLLAARAAQRTAAARPNPSVGLGAADDEGLTGIVSPWIVPLKLDWPIETAGRRGDRMAQAQHLAAAARWDLVGTVWQVRSRLRAALLAVDAARRTEALLARDERARRTVLQLLEAQLRAGNVSSYEVTQARIGLDRATLARQAAAGRLRQARVTLAGAIGVPVRALAGVRLSFAALRALPAGLTRPQIRRQALLGRPDVRAALERYAASQSALQLEIARQWPDITLGPGFTWNAQLAGDRQWELGLTLPLPVMSRNRGPIAQAKARRELAAAHFLTVQADAITQIDGALSAYRSARAELATASSLLADLARQLDSVRAQVRVGEMQPLELADARIAYDAGAMSRLESQIEAEQALGRLEDAVQSPLMLAPSVVSAARRQAAGEAASR